jgi:hypothetical protein
MALSFSFSVSFVLSFVLFLGAGAWRLAVARREQSLRWVALVAEAKEPASDPRTRFDHLAELVIILAEHAGTYTPLPTIDTIKADVNECVCDGVCWSW